LPTANIVEGANAELTLFNLKESTNMSKSDSASKSANSPFWDLTLKGKIIGTVVKNTLHINS
jgi:dihydroorotase-like cyclic amidohydrolase